MLDRISIKLLIWPARGSSIVEKVLTSPNVYPLRQSGAIFAVAARWAGRVEFAPTSFTPINDSRH
jgi:hypothetical protein